MSVRWVEVPIEVQGDSMQGLRGGSDWSQCTGVEAAGMSGCLDDVVYGNDGVAFCEGLSFLTAVSSDQD